MGEIEVLEKIALSLVGIRIELGWMLNDPGSLTLRELMGACRRGGIPAERIREAIRFDY